MPVRSAVSVLATEDPVAAVLAAVASDLDLALPTSGTSGPARTVVRRARSWARSFAAVSELTGTDAHSRVWLPGPLSATMNLFAAAHARWVGAEIIDALAPASHLHLTPARLRALVEAHADLAARTVVVAGDGLDPQLRRAAESGGARVHHYYGAAELSFVAWGSDRDHLEPMPGVEVEIRDHEIWVRSPYLARGYLNEAPGPLRFDPQGFATVGDRGRLDGRRLIVLGRAEAVTTAGATVVLADVEARIRPAIAGEVAVVGLPHPRLGQVLVAVLTEGADTPAARRAVADLAAAKPRRWFTRSALPLTAAGKLDRAAVVRDLLAPTADAS